jgi:hypothetical protein
MMSGKTHTSSAMVGKLWQYYGKTIAQKYNTILLLDPPHHVSRAERGFHAQKNGTAKT